MKDPTLCRERGCKNPRRAKRRRCHKCQKRIHVKNQPAMASYHLLKSHSTARGVPCTVTFEEFLLFATETGYLNGKGPHASSLTIDRIKNELGYVTGNLQVMTRAKNSEKRARHDAIRMRQGFAWNGGVNPKEKEKTK